MMMHEPEAHSREPGQACKSSGVDELTLSVRKWPLIGTSWVQIVHRTTAKENMSACTKLTLQSSC